MQIHPVIKYSASKFSVRKKITLPKQLQMPYTSAIVTDETPNLHLLVYTSNWADIESGEVEITIGHNVTKITSNMPIVVKTKHPTRVHPNLVLLGACNPHGRFDKLTVDEFTHARYCEFLQLTLCRSHNDETDYDSFTTMKFQRLNFLTYESKSSAEVDIDCRKECVIADKIIVSSTTDTVKFICRKLSFVR
jgi:hypothetical protein